MTSGRRRQRPRVGDAGRCHTGSAGSRGATGPDHDGLAASPARQHGLVSLEQAVAAGVPPRCIRHQARSGRWRPICTLAVLRLAGTPATWERGPCWPRASPPGRRPWPRTATAARLWGLLPPGRRRRRSSLNLARPQRPPPRRAPPPVDPGPRSTTSRTGAGASPSPRRPGPWSIAHLAGAVGRSQLGTRRSTTLIRRGRAPHRRAWGVRRPSWRLLAAFASRPSGRRRTSGSVREPDDSAGELWVYDTILQAAGLPHRCSSTAVVAGGRRRRARHRLSRPPASPSSSTAIHIHGRCARRSTTTDPARTTSCSAAGPSSGSPAESTAAEVIADVARALTGELPQTS